MGTLRYALGTLVYALGTLGNALGTLGSTLGNLGYTLGSSGTHLGLSGTLLVTSEVKRRVRLSNMLQHSNLNLDETEHLTLIDIRGHKIPQLLV